MVIKSSRQSVSIRELAWSLKRVKEFMSAHREYCTQQKPSSARMQVEYLCGDITNQ